MTRSLHDKHFYMTQGFYIDILSLSQPAWSIHLQLHLSTYVQDNNKKKLFSMWSFSITTWTLVGVNLGGARSYVLTSQQAKESITHASTSLQDFFIRPDSC